MTDKSFYFSLVILKINMSAIDNEQPQICLCPLNEVTFFKQYPVFICRANFHLW
jgi:hypothetical protein